MIEKMVDKLDKVYDEIIIRLKKLPVNTEYELGMFVMSNLNRSENILILLDQAIIALDDR